MHDVQSPRTDDNAIEQEIKAKGLTAPRVTPQDIADNIRNAYFFTAKQGAEREHGIHRRREGGGVVQPRRRRVARRRV